MTSESCGSARCHTNARKRVNVCIAWEGGYGMQQRRVHGCRGVQLGKVGVRTSHEGDSSAGRSQGPFPASMDVSAQSCDCMHGACAQVRTEVGAYENCKCNRQVIPRPAGGVIDMAVGV
eukprot:360781-Chlamydomonas_euryale.AAC.5